MPRCFYLFLFWIIILYGCDSPKSFSSIIIRPEMMNWSFFVRPNASVFYQSDSVLIARFERVNKQQNITQDVRTEVICFNSKFNIKWNKEFSNSLQINLIPIDLIGVGLVCTRLNQNEIDTILINCSDGEDVLIDNFEFRRFGNKVGYEIKDIVIPWQDSLSFKTSLEKRTFSLFKRNELEEKDSLPKDMAIKNWFYDKEGIPDYLFFSNDTCLFVKKIGLGNNINKIKLPKSSKTLLSYDTDHDRLYIQHKNLYCLDLETKIIKFESTIDIGNITDWNNYLTNKQWIYKKFILAFGDRSFCLINKNTGAIIKEVYVGEDDMDIVDAAVFKDNIVIATSSPVSLIRIPISSIVMKE